MARFFATAAGVLGFAAVTLGAFGAHGLKSHFDAFPDLRPIYETAVHYHMYHALALLGVAHFESRQPKRATRFAGVCFIIGIVLFSGSLYALAITGLRWLGAITPLGGVAMLLGWASLVVSARRSFKPAA